MPYRRAIFPIPLYLICFLLIFCDTASLLCLLLKATPRNYPMLRSLINFTPNAWDFLPQQRRLPQKSSFTPPKFLSIPARQIPLYCLYFLRGNRLFCRFIFPHETISVSAIFLWMKKAHRAKIVRIAKVYPCEVFLRSKTGFLKRASRAFLKARLLRK